MNRTSTIQTNSIAQNCRSILRERCCIQRACNQSHGLNTSSRQECPPKTWKPCLTIPTNPIYSPYGVDNLSGSSPRMSPNGFDRRPSCVDRSIAPMQPILNKQTSHVQYLSIPTENCIQMITNAIINNIRHKISYEESALLCSCLPSLIRQIMCKSPWLTPNDVIQWLSADIIKEAMNHFDTDELNDKNTFHKSKQNHNSEERLTQSQSDSISNDNHSIKSHENDNDSLSSFQSTSSQESIPSQRSALNPPNNVQKNQKSREHQRKKTNKTRVPSTHSFTNQQNNDLESNSHSSNIRSPRNIENKSKKSQKKAKPSHTEDDERSISSHSYLSTNTFDSNENFDQKSVDVSPKSQADKQSRRDHIKYPGKKDPKAIQDVKKCLAFYHQIREYFDDDVAAMLLKCCLCSSDCSGQR